MRGEGKRDPRPADSPGRLRQSENGRRQMKNLKPYGPGETGNREGKNGAKWLSEFRRFFDSKATSQDERSRFYFVCQKLYANALKGSDSAIKTIVEHMKGKAVESVDLTSSDGSMSGGAPHAIAIRVVHSTREEADAAKAEQGESIFGDGTGNNDSSQG